MWDDLRVGWKAHQWVELWAVDLAVQWELPQVALRVV
jgi:hypothetical protein